MPARNDPTPEGLNVGSEHDANNYRPEGSTAPKSAEKWPVSEGLYIPQCRYFFVKFSSPTANARGSHDHDENIRELLESIDQPPR